MEVVGPVKRILRDDRVPSINTIKIKLSMPFGKTSSLLDSVLSKCAEVTESIICEAVEKATPTVYVNRRNWQPDYRYYCSYCKAQKIYNSHKYCPECGHKIVWLG